MEAKLTRNEVVAGGAVLGALALVFVLLGFNVPFGPIPYLRFELAEIPVVLAALLFGPVGGFISSFEYWMVLQVVGVDLPFGPPLKFFATSSMVFGLWLGSSLFSKLNIKSSMWRFSLVVLPIAAIVRALILTVANWAILIFFAPSFLPFATSMLGGFLGSSFSDQTQGLIFVLAFTGLFNVIHMLISYLPSAFLSSSVVVRYSKFGGKYWVRRYTLPTDQ